MAKAAIAPGYARLMARYNEWQNDSLISAADGLDDADRQLDRGGFWRSIHGTLSHILWGDRLWMSRFAGETPPEVGIRQSDALVADWAALKQARKAQDARITAWADGLTEEWLAGEITWHSAAMNRSLTRPAALLVMHMFNHQTHHRGQVHAMLTAAGAKPGDTDLMLLAG